MNWWETVNPFTYLGNAASSVVADAWTTGMLGIWNAGLWLLRFVLGIEDAFLTPDVSEHGPMSGIYPVTFWVAGVLVVALMMVQLAVAVTRRDGQSLARVLLGIAQFGAVWVIWVVYAVAVLAAAGGLTQALMRSLLHVDSMSAWQPWTGFSTADITDGTMATVLGVLGFVLILAAFGHLLVMLTRGAALLVLAATNPIAAAGLVFDGGRSWFWKAFRWFHAAAFTPALMMLMLGLGVQVSSSIAIDGADSLPSAVGTAVPAVVLILIGCFAPLALFKLLAFVDPGTSSGAAMRAGLTAQGGLQGLLRGGQGASSSAASTADADGRSGGEAATEAATSGRFATAAGGLAGALGAAGRITASGLGIVAGLGARAAVIGADMSNQMGVGHNTYVPDFSPARSHGGAGPAALDPAEDNPDINGAGPDPGNAAADGATSQPPPPPPPMPHPGAPAGAGAAGGAGAEGAAAVPIVPV